MQCPVLCDTVTTVNTSHRPRPRTVTGNVSVNTSHRPRPRVVTGSISRVNFDAETSNDMHLDVAFLKSERPLTPQQSSNSDGLLLMFM